MAALVVSRVLAGVVLLVLAARADAGCGPIDERFTVRRGDQLGDLVRRLALPDCTWPHVARANRLKNPNLIQPGQVLQMPRGVVHLRDNLARLADLSGDVRWPAQGGQPAALARAGDPLTIGRVLETGARSAARVVLDNGIEARWLPMTQASLTGLSGSAKGLQATMTLTQGRLDLKVPVSHVPPSDARQLRIRTPSMVLAVRGTRFEVMARENAAWASTYEGQVAVTAAGQTLDLPAGQGVAVDGDRRTATLEALLPAPALQGLPTRVSQLPVRFDLASAQPARWRALLARDAAGVDIVNEQALASPVAHWGLLPPGRYVMALQQVSDLGIAGFPSQHAFEVGVQATLLGPGRWLSPDWLARPDGIALDLPPVEADQSLLVQLSGDAAGQQALWQAVSLGGELRLPGGVAILGAWLHVWRVEPVRP